MLSEVSSTFHASDGAAYDVWLGRWSSRLANAFLDFADFPQTGPMLDVGCGTGSLTFAMAQRWPDRSVTGVDLSVPFITHAQLRRRGDQPRFEVGDACALKYPDGHFAGATAHLVFLFIPRPEVALREMRRVTRSGGTVAAIVWDSRGGLVFQRMMWDTAVAIDPNARSARDSLFANPVAIPGGLAGFFHDAGFENVETRSVTIRMDFENFQDYWQPFLGGQGPVGAYFSGLSPGLSARIEEAVRDAYCSGSPDGRRSLTATAWAVQGKVPLIRKRERSGGRLNTTDRWAGK
jgi:ubiquinone/menaquinone biosynthesis C-methylase UbiE